MSVIRITMFKVPSKEDQAIMVAGYKVLAKSHKKDGAPYILSLESGPAGEDARSQGYTFVAKSVFKSKEDFDYYDSVCQAHQDFKDLLKAKSVKVEGMMMVYYTPEITAYL